MTQLDLFATPPRQPFTGENKRIADWLAKMVGGPKTPTFLIDIISVTTLRRRLVTGDTYARIGAELGLSAEAVRKKAARLGVKSTLVLGDASAAAGDNARGDAGTESKESMVSRRPFEFSYPFFDQVYRHIAWRGVEINSFSDTFLFGGRKFSIPDLNTMLDGFYELDADPEHVGDAVAAMVLDHFGIEHSLSTHGITLAICGRAA
jgi:hypothetical protein